MNENGKIAMAVAGGYVLGRTKKAKLAIGMGMWLAGKRLNLDLRQLPQALGRIPGFNGVSEQVRTQLVDAGKSAATAAITRKADDLADSLHRRTELVRDGGPLGKDDEDDPGRDEYREGSTEAEAEDDEGSGSGEEPEEEQPAPRRARKTAKSAPKKGRKAVGSATGTAKSTAKGTARKAAGRATGRAKNG
jgi:hypothetical protein